MRPKFGNKVLHLLSGAIALIHVGGYVFFSPLRLSRSEKCLHGMMQMQGLNPLACHENTLRIIFVYIITDKALQAFDILALCALY